MAALRLWIAASVLIAALWGQGSEYPALKYRSNYLASYYLSHAPNTSPWWPSWSPDGKWIAVAMYGSIWRGRSRPGGGGGGCFKPHTPFFPPSARSREMVLFYSPPMSAALSSCVVGVPRNA